jgi:pilus assembly protein CpaE
VALNLKLVSTDPQFAQIVRETGGRCAVVSPDALSGLAHPTAQQPDILIVDMRGVSQFPPALTLLKRQHPKTGVLLIMTELDPALMLEAMRAGVNECLASPVSSQDLQAAFKRLAAQLAPSVRGEVFAFIGAKGGVGATTVAVNVASALAKANTDSTLLIDLNVACGDAAVFLGAEPRFSVLDALENVNRLDDAFFRGLVVRGSSGLDLLGASGRTTTGGIEATKLRTLLDFASQTHRYLVLDVPRSDTTVLDSLEAATKIVLVANQELATVRSASRMAATLRQRYGRDRIALVLTRTDRRAEIGHEDVERTVGIEVRHTFPSDYRLALQAMNKGRPIVLEGQNELAGAFKAFARELSGEPDYEASPKGKSSGSLFGLLAPKRA